MSTSHPTGDDIFLMLLEKAKTRELSEEEKDICHNIRDHINDCPECMAKFNLYLANDNDILNAVFTEKVDALVTEEETGMSLYEEFDDSFLDYDDEAIHEKLCDLRLKLLERAIFCNLPFEVIKQLREYAIGKSPLISTLGLIFKDQSVRLTRKMASILEAMLIR
jgi:hypothetical protein